MRTEKQVKDEIADVEAKYQSAVNAARDDYEKSERAARIAATVEVGKIERTFVEPEIEKLRKVRDAIRAKAKAKHDAAVAAAHGEYNKDLREADAMFDAGRVAVGTAAATEKSKHDDVYNEKKSRYAEDRVEKVEKAGAERKTAMAPLLKEMAAIEAAKPKAVESEVPLAAEAPLKKTKAKSKSMEV